MRTYDITIRHCCQGKMADKGACDDDICYLQNIFGVNKREFLDGSYRKEHDILESIVEGLKEKLLKEHPQSSEAIQTGCEQLSARLASNHQISFGIWFEWCNRYILSVPRCIPVLDMRLKAGDVGSMKAPQDKLDNLDSQIKTTCHSIQVLESKLKDADLMILECEETLRMLAVVKEKQNTFQEAVDYHGRHSMEALEELNT